MQRRKLAKNIISDVISAKGLRDRHIVLNKNSSLTSAGFVIFSWFFQQHAGFLEFAASCCFKFCRTRRRTRKSKCKFTVLDNDSIKIHFQSCFLINGDPGECVPPHLCLNGKVNRNGTFLIDIRLESASGCHFLEDCCDTGQIAPVTLPPPILTGDDPQGGYMPKTPVTPTVSRITRCGLRNPNGLGYRIMEVVDNESEYGK